MTICPLSAVVRITLPFLIARLVHWGIVQRNSEEHKQTMIKSSKAVALMLIGSIAVLWGFKSCADHYAYDDDGYGGTTRPSSYAHRGYRPSHFFWRSGRGSSRSGGSSFHSTGTSRGGFGGSGHAASS
jgi:hypothetical protein